MQTGNFHTRILHFKKKFLNQKRLTEPNPNCNTKRTRSELNFNSNRTELNFESNRTEPKLKLVGSTPISTVQV